MGRITDIVSFVHGERRGKTNQNSFVDTRTNKKSFRFREELTPLDLLMDRNKKVGRFCRADTGFVDTRTNKRSFRCREELNLLDLLLSMGRRGEKQTGRDL
jgi:hypothetical protein